MALYTLTYDLVNNKNYPRIYEELKDFNAVRVTESQWCFKRFNTTAKGLRNHFAKLVDDDDRVMVVQVANIEGVPQWAGNNLINSPNDLK